MELRSFVIGILICFILSFAVGLERQYRGRFIGLRTAILLAVGTYMFVSMSFMVGGSRTDITRIAAGIVSILIFNGSRLFNLSGGDKLTYTGEPCYSLGDFLHNPLKFVLVYLNTLRYLWSDWVSEAMGLVLMGVPTGIPAWLRFFFLMLLFITTFSSEQKFSSTQRIFSFIILFGSVLLIMTAELFIWTPKGASQIAGVQGRYFLPYFPLFFFAVRNNVFATTIPLEKYICITEVFMQFYIVFMIVNQTL